MYRYEFLIEQDELPFFVCYTEAERAAVYKSMNGSQLTFRFRKTLIGQSRV
jgi:hypothetical protein